MRRIRAAEGLFAIRWVMAGTVREGILPQPPRLSGLSAALRKISGTEERKAERDNSARESCHRKPATEVEELDRSLRTVRISACLAVRRTCRTLPAFRPSQRQRACVWRATQGVALPVRVWQRLPGFAPHSGHSTSIAFILPVYPNDATALRVQIPTSYAITASFRSPR